MAEKHTAEKQEELLNFKLSQIPENAKVNGRTAQAALSYNCRLEAPFSILQQSRFVAASSNHSRKILLIQQQKRMGFTSQQNVN